MALASRSVGAMHGILNAPSHGFSEKPSDPLEILPILLGIWEQDGKQSLPLDQTSFEYCQSWGRIFGHVGICLLRLGCLSLADLAYPMMFDCHLSHTQFPRAEPHEDRPR